MFDLMRNHHLESLHFQQDEKIGFNAVIAIHSSRRGPALGGCRLIPYSTELEAIADAARLARGMSYKAALANINYGGGKAVIMRPAVLKNRDALFHAMGEFIEHLDGQYIAAVDSGSSSADMDIIALHTDHTTSTSAAGDPSPYTARGVLAGIQAALEHRYGSPDLGGIHVCIQGLGKVGAALACVLHQHRARLSISDVDPQKCRWMTRKTGARIVSPEQILSERCQVVSPCALGGVVDENSVEMFNCDIIAGSANNQLADESFGQQLHSRGILYAPDFAINSGGLIYVALQRQSISLQNIYDKIDAIGGTLEQIFRQSHRHGFATNTVATHLAEEKLHASSPGEGDRYVSNA